MTSWTEPKLKVPFNTIAEIFEDLYKIIKFSYNIETGSVYIHNSKNPRRYSFIGLFNGDYISNIFNLIIAADKKIPKWFYEKYRCDYISNEDWLKFVE